ncbi:hypothetical protein BKA66DRAFT_574821 [Pyrenochaeta sp. MPI-SDFR-AT-0127]|nr:hypothetical protein BKA66DRAFT_574821 [Pyrenochaeta sp. MPI-SDFR-AT-0127]
MQLIHFLTAALVATAHAATFKGFSNKACQRYDGTYVTVTAAQLKDLAVQGYPVADVVPQASSFFTPNIKAICPSNSDDTYKWIDVPQWQEGNVWGPGNGGAIAVVYYKQTDTYNLCIYAANAQTDGYGGSCK